MTAPTTPLEIPLPDPLATARLDALLARLDGAAQGVPLNRLDLGGMQAGGDTLARRRNGVVEAPAWWDGELGGLKLEGADLRGARLQGTDFGRANLDRAHLAGASARLLRADGARLEGADLTGADLGGASFQGVVAGEASFAEVLGEDANFSHASMRFARFTGASLDGAVFDDADLWGVDFSGADADGTSFRQARLDEADLSNVNLTGANFVEASLRHAKLTGSRLKGANLSGAALDGADLSGADLTNVTLVRIDLSSCNLRGARFAGSWLSETRLRVEQIGEAVGEELARDYATAEAAYKVLERNFVSLGAKDEAGWAYRKGRRMGRSHAAAQARHAWRARDPRGFCQHGYRWLADRFVEWLCDYGESLSRIARAFAVLILVFAALYGLSAGLIADGAPTRDLLDLLSYSALNMLTANPPDIGFKPVGRFTNALVAGQGAVGIVLMGLFGFVLGNRLRR